MTRMEWRVKVEVGEGVSAKGDVWVKELKEAFFPLLLYTIMNLMAFIAGWSVTLPLVNLKSGKKRRVGVPHGCNNIPRNFNLHRRLMSPYLLTCIPAAPAFCLLNWKQEAREVLRKCD